MLADDVLAFVRSSIKSVWTLELLLLLRRNRHVWTVERLTAELRSSELIVTDALDQLVKAGIVARDDVGYRYHTINTALDLIIHQLETTYSERPLAVVKAIHAVPSDKIKNFADAFRFRND